MTAKNKKALIRIVLSSVLLAVAALADHFSLLPTVITIWGFDLQALLIFAIPYLIIGHDVLWSAIRNIIGGEVFDENFLMSIATIAAFATGEYTEAVFVMLFYQVGELFQSIAVGKSRRSIKALLSIKADFAYVEGENGELREVECENVNVGDVISVKPGGKIPLDGVIIDGRTTVNTVALTGEAIPREANAGDAVLSGCINESSPIRIKVSKPYSESTVAKILSLVEDSSANKSKSEAFITKFAKYYTPTVVIAALLLAVIPPMLIDINNGAIWKQWVLRAMAFLVISCPCALVISVPLSYFGGIGAASARGILIKGSAYLDALSKCDTVVFDKTGTLTEGAFEVSQIDSYSSLAKNEILAISASAEKYSSHPISLSICRAYDGINACTSRRVSEVEEIAGRGIKALTDQKRLLVGNAALMSDNGIIVDSDDTHTGVFVYVALDEILIGRITVSDTVRSTSHSTILNLRRLGIKKTVMLTGDRSNVAKAIAAKLSLDEYRAELLPADKVSALEEIMKKDNRVTAYVGDGINDAPVLARADVGIAMGALGSDAAIESADIVLMDDDPERICEAILLARRTRCIVIENIVFALGVKAITLILSAIGIVGLGLAVFADVGVAVIAILNSMRNLKK